MVSQGFTATTGYRLLDPTAVFGADRSAYYRHLEAADSLDPEDIIGWCTYLLGGMLDDLRKLERLGDHDFVINELLRPSFTRAVAAGAINMREQQVLEVFALKTEAKAADLADAFTGTSVARSQFLRQCIERRLLEPIAEGKRTYRLVMSPGPLTPFIFRQLDALGFLPQILREDL